MLLKKSFLLMELIKRLSDFLKRFLISELLIIKFFSSNFFKQGLVLGLSLLFVQVFSGCSSSTDTYDKENVRYEKKTDKIVNIDLAEREYISLSKINLIEKISFDLASAGTPSKGKKLSTQKYNSRGFLIETIMYDNDGNIQQKFSYEYDKNGVRTNTTRFNSAGQPVNIFKYDYNMYGNKTKAYRYDLNEKLIEYYIYIYDNRSNLLEEVWYNIKDEKIYRLENKYYNDRKIETCTFDERSRILYKYVYKYDNNGNIIEELKYDSYGDQVGIIQYVYKYF